MLYPTLTELNSSREWLDTFKGYNHNLRIGEGEFYEMTNLSSDNFPILAPRSKRGTYATPGIPQGLVAKDSLCYVDGGDLIIGENDRVSAGLTIEKDEHGKIIPKTLISMGAYVIIMPDKKYINTIPTIKDGERVYECDYIEAHTETTSTVTFTLCKLDGADYEISDENISNTPPSSPENMELWIDTSQVPHVLKQYSSTSSMWSTVATTYIKISSLGIGMRFEEGDGVTISGIESEELADLNATFVIQAKGDGYIVVIGILDKVTTQSTPIKVERKMPDMDFIIESGNRLWGCRYGEQGNKNVNEIYASKLGDFKNWNCFLGVSTDSYAVSVGTDGEFTGATTHLGYPIFFKENCMHKVYGNYPANYQIQTTICRGVQKGCFRSLATVNEVLYYKSRGGVCAYDGSLPQEISSALGEVSYSEAVAGSLGNKYYISMVDSNGAYHLFVYDTSKGMWHREDDTQALDFCNFRGDLYYIDYKDNQIKSVKGNGVKDSKPIKWEAVTGIIGTDSPDKKYISRMDVRMKLEANARVSFYAEYDSDGEYEYLFTTPLSESLKSFAVPIRPKRCDHMRLKIVGVGDAKIFSICKTIEWGSDK